MPPDIDALIPFEGRRSGEDVSLPTRIQQLVKQKGTFRAITEAGLAREVQDATCDFTVKSDMSIDSDEDKELETRQTLLDKLYQARMEELHRLGFMAFRMGTFVDAFAMSLTSKSRVAENAISKKTKSAVPPNSLDSHKVVRRPISKLSVRRADEIALAARLETFKNAAAHLEGASARLQTEANKQANFWAELAAIRSKGWQVSRAPNKTKTFVVHIGSQESEAQYTDKGTATLRQDEHGSLTFDGADSMQNQKVLLVRIVRDSNVTGQCHFRKEFNTSSPIEAKLVRARESLFQDELFTEICKEARGMANMGIIIRDGLVEVRLPSSLSIQIQYSRIVTPSIEHSQEDNHLAEYFCANLRLMLVAEHQQRHLQRTQHRPAPITLHSRPVSDYVVLRPVVCQVRHQLDIASVLKSLDTYGTVLKHTGLDMKLAHHLSTEHQNSIAKLSELRHMVISNLDIELPSGRSMRLVAQTLLAAPRFGTQWCATRLKGTECGDTIFPQTVSSSDTIRAIEDSLVRDITSVIMRQSHGTATWQVESTYPLSLTLSNKGRSLLGLAVSCSGGKVVLSTTSKSKNAKGPTTWAEDGMTVAGSLSGEHSTLAEQLAKVLEDV